MSFFLVLAFQISFQTFCLCIMWGLFVCFFRLCWVFVPAGFSLVVASWGLSLGVACSPLIAVAFLTVEHGLWARGLSSYSFWALGRRLSSCGAWA